MATIAPRRGSSQLRKLWPIFEIYLSECFAYPAASFIWVLADAMTAIILPAVWLAAGNTTIGGFQPSQLVTYYLISMTLSQFITCYLMWDIAWDIREGFFTTALVRPMSVFSMNIARNFAWRLAKLVLFIPLAVLLFLAYWYVHPASNLHFTGQFFLAVLLAQTLSYVSAFCIAMTALWTVEFMSVLRLYYLTEMFMSGRILPLTTLPGWAQTGAKFVHFRYTNAFPVLTLMGELSPSEVTQGLLIQVGWIAFFCVLARVLFNRGVRQYSGVGM